MNIYLVLICTLLILSFLLETSASLLNLGALKPHPPEEFKEDYSEAEYSRMHAYTRQRTRFSIVHDSVFLVLTLGFLLAGGFNQVDLIARSLGFGPIVTGLLFTGILALLSAALQLPFSIYSTFVLEARFGFNTTSVRTFVLDQVKGAVLAIVLGAPLLAAILWFFQETGSMAWLYAWAAITLFMLVVQLLAPVLILPLFNRFTPLPEGPLRDGITSYARRLNFSIEGIYTMDGSKRSTRANAFFTGFGRFRRIVFFDTLLSQLKPGEIVAVLAHEMGHYKLKHVPLMLALAIAQTGLMLFILSLFLGNAGLFAAFQMEYISVYAALIFFGFLYSPLATLLETAMNALSRRHEYQADRFAVTSGAAAADLISGLKGLTVKNLGNLTPHPLSVVLHYSHPPMLARIRALRRLETQPLPAQAN